MTEELIKESEKLLSECDELLKDTIYCTCGNLLTGWDVYCNQCGMSKHSLEIAKLNNLSLGSIMLPKIDLLHIIKMVEYVKKDLKKISYNNIQDQATKLERVERKLNSYLKGVLKND